MAQPKQEYEPADVYKHQEFRGLLHADHQEAVITVLNKKSTSYITRYPTQGANLRNTQNFNSTMMKTVREGTYGSDLPKIMTHD